MMFVESGETHGLTEEKILFLLAQVIGMLALEIIKPSCTILKVQKMTIFQLAL
jgi:hypothetical protein